MVECPHCHVQVLLRRDGKCPACGQDPRDERGSTPHLTEVRIYELQALPAHCIRCDAQTKRLLKVTRKRRLGGEATWIQMLLAVVRPRLLLQDGVTGNRQRVDVKLPVCERCQRSGATEPGYVNFEPPGYMRFVVHRDFAARLTSP